MGWFLDSINRPMERNHLGLEVQNEGRGSECFVDVRDKLKNCVHVTVEVVKRKGVQTGRKYRETPECYDKIYYTSHKDRQEPSPNQT